ncbi:hypothetical protein [Dethiothermospora halolimnae]|uniref:hypothetical protein n=1 Tax=Dethiothermospora halolimnae TaxID=3114390 RepID=UPI003CCBE00B
MRGFFYPYTPPPPPPFNQPNDFRDGPPASPPPSFTPQPSPFRVDPGSIKQCRRKFTYIWLSNGDAFWFYPTFIGRRSISGFRWTGFMWVFYGTDLRNITSFICY